MFRRKNILCIGILFLLIFIAAAWLVGIGIDRTANGMYHALLGEAGRYRSELIAVDFRRTVKLLDNVEAFLKRKPDDEKGLQEILMGIVRLDAKVTRGWYQAENGEVVSIDSTGLPKRDALLATTLGKIVTEKGKKGKGSLYYSDGILYWTVYRKCAKLTFGFDVSLQGLHSYFANMSPQVKSYAFVLNEEGFLIVHPDEKRIGQHYSDAQLGRQLTEVWSANKAVQGPGFSQYLLLDVERVLYPVTVGAEKWVVVINVPRFLADEEMRYFHRYALFIAILTIVLFSVLLALFQRRWRKEYDRRRKLEQEAVELNMQQLRNQVNPHFLFNSLNSLNALIGNEPAMAKEFVLRLSKIYRYVLEKKDESLVAVKEETGFIRNYYFLQRIRFDEQLEVEIDPALDGEERKIPLMSLQMLIENAIKHNEITRKHPLRIRIYCEGEEIRVENNYHPRADKTEDSFGVGFENIRRIYEYCSDKRFTYQVEEGRFICRLPLL